MTQKEEETKELIEEMKQTYSNIFIDHAINAPNMGKIPQADAYAKYTGPCGDTIEMWFRVKDGKIEKASFITDGCVNAIACGSMATELVTSKSIAEASKISADDIIETLGGLPEEEEHCALLASDTIKSTIRDYIATKNEPWEKVYRIT